MTVEGIGVQPLETVTTAELPAAVRSAVEGGGRFAGLFGTPRQGGSLELRAVVARPGSLGSVAAVLAPGELSYPTLSVDVPAAAWYERELHDRYGIVPQGHPRLDPLVLPLLPDARRPGWPGDRGRPVTPDSAALEAHASGEGLFTIPYGPVRSGVFESVEFLVETFGEDIPRLRSRVHHKHRAVDLRFEDLAPADGVLLAERVEGTASVSHALAYSQALEALCRLEVSEGAELVRLVHAELERIVNHLESMIRHTEGSYQAVANARLAVHKERLMRLRAALSGSRFGRDVVVPGGVRGPLAASPAGARRELRGIEQAVSGDTKALMTTPSFLDRLRGAGTLPGALVAAHGALGPVGRGSGVGEDTRLARPYGAYRSLELEASPPGGEGDALARQVVRLAEVRESFRLVSEALTRLDRVDEHEWRKPLDPVPDGAFVSAVEAPQGELLYLVEVEGEKLTRVKPRCAAFHNFALFPQAFRGDILTDFVFIEASFAVSIAGVSG